MKEKEYIYYIYKITLLCGSLKNSYYIGKRKFKVPKYYSKDQIYDLIKSNPMIDKYKGSGKIITNYFKKYNPKFGVTFIKEIITFSETFEENYKDEERIIGDLWKTDNKCLNLIKGGVCVQNPESVSQQVLLYNKSRENPFKGIKHTERTKQLDRLAAIERWKDPIYRDYMSIKLKEIWKTRSHPNKGKHLSEEQKQHLRKINLGKPNPKNAGKNNGMCGKTPTNARIVLQLDDNGNVIAEFTSLDAAARSFGSKRGSNIRKVITGERELCFGYKWKYKE